MQTWLVGDREVTNREGAREYLGLSANTAAVYFSPSGRTRHGVPEPLPERVDGQEVYGLDDLAAFKQARERPRGIVAAADPDADPDELIGLGEFAALLGKHVDRVMDWATDSLPAWERGEEGLLPVPDESKPWGTAGRMRHRWRRARAVEFAGRVPRRTSTGRPPASAPRPTVADLREVLATLPFGADSSAREIAAALSTRLGVPVTAQAVQRLRKRASEQPDG